MVDSIDINKQSIYIFIEMMCILANLTFNLSMPITVREFKQNLKNKETKLSLLIFKLNQYQNERVLFSQGGRIPGSVY